MFACNHVKASAFGTSFTTGSSSIALKCATCRARVPDSITAGCALAAITFPATAQTWETRSNWRIRTFISKLRLVDLLPLVTPGEMLVEEFLKPLGLTEYRLAKDIGVPPRRINEIVHGKRAITTDTAFRLSQYFGNSP